jgi:hypothetical protein
MRDPMEEAGFTLVQESQGSPEPEIVQAPAVTQEAQQPSPQPTNTAGQDEKQNQTQAESTVKQAEAQDVVPELKFGEASETTQQSTPPPFNVKEIFGVELPLDEIKKRVSEYENIVNQLNNRYANKESELFDKAMRDGLSPENYFKARSLDIENMTPVERVVMYTMLSKGISEEDARIIVNEKYNLDLEPYKAENEYELTDEQIRENQRIARLQRSGQAMLKADDKEAIKFLSQYKSDLLTPPQQKAAEIANKIEQTWASPVKELSKTIATVSYGDFKYNTPEQDLISIQEKVLQTLKEFGGVDMNPGDPKSQEMIKDMLVSQWKADSFDRFFRQLNAHYAKQLLEYKHNPSKGPTAVIQKNQPSETDGVASPHEMFRQMAEQGF